MEKQYKRQKRDWIFLGIVLVAAVAGLLWFFLGYSTPGTMVEISIDGETAGTYPLAEARVISLPPGQGETNRLVIAEGKASMEWADCPDQICVEHRAISHGGEEIVCLPNRIVVRILEADKKGQQLDAVTR